VVAALAIIALVVVWMGGPAAAERGAPVPTFTVEPGPLTISVSETGTIRSREQVILKSEVEGRNAILYLIPEGTLVKKGDLLVELDASELQDEFIEEQIETQNAEAEMIRARENLEVVKNQAQADVSEAKLNYRFAQEDLKVYEEGEYPKQVKELEARLALAEQELQRANREVEGSRILYEEKYISETELQADELAAKKAQLDVELAKDQLELLQTHTHKRRVDELEAAVEQTEMALERAKRKASADVLQAEADLRAKQAEHTQEKNRLEDVTEQLVKTKIHAPRDGMVVYATSTRASWRGNDEPLQEGQEVREREELIYLPTADQMMATVKIQEPSLDTVEVGMPVQIKVDAIPGKRFTGRVAKIAPLPDASSVWLNPDLKVYDTEIHIQENDAALRTGMNCTATIVAAHYDEATYVPIQAVVRRGNQPTVYVRGGVGFEPRPVELGLDNNRLVRIVEGLDDGEVVSLSPPLEAGSAQPLQLAGLETTEAAEAKAAPGERTEADSSGDRKRPGGQRQQRQAAGPRAEARP
jgi:HlyD family secretion protein